MVGIEAGVRLLGRVQAARHQAGADEQQHRHGHLRHDERRTQAGPCGASGRQVVLHHRHEIQP